jgi:RNA polymerase sigma-70 factor (ECF subfamily)
MGISGNKSDDMRASWKETVRAAVREFESPLLVYAFRLLKNEEEAQDVVQETFLRLCAQDPGRLEGRISVWLFSVCRNLCMDTMRKRARSLAVGQELSRIVEKTTESDTAEHGEAVSLAGRAIDALTPRQQEIIRLKFESGLSYREIAEITHTTVTNVGFIIHTAIKKIREQITQHQV